MHHGSCDGNLVYIFLWFSCIYASRYVCGCLVKKLYTWLYLVYVVQCIHQRRNDRATVSMRSNNECLTKLPSRSRKKNFKTRDKKDPLCIEKEKKILIKNSWRVLYHLSSHASHSFSRERNEGKKCSFFSYAFIFDYMIMMYTLSTQHPYSLFLVFDHNPTK